MKHYAFLAQCGPLGRVAASFICADANGAGDLILHGEDIVHVPVVAFGPEVVIIVCADQLGVDAKAVARLPYTSFQYVPYL